MVQLVKFREQAVGRMNNVLTRRLFFSLYRKPALITRPTVIRLTIETGTVTALAAIIDLVFFVSQKNGLHQVSGVILGKLYTNTLLVLFNNRMLMTSRESNQSDMPLAGHMTLRNSSHHQPAKGHIPMHHVRKAMTTLDTGNDSEVQNDFTNSDWTR